MNEFWYLTLNLELPIILCMVLLFNYMIVFDKYDNTKNVPKEERYKYRRIKHWTEWIPFVTFFYEN